MIRKAAERLADLIDPDRALREAARIAYSDIRELYDEYGRMLPVQQWPDHVAAAVSSIEVRSSENGSAISARVKFWDKTPALALLFKRHGLLEPDPQVLPKHEPTKLQFVVEHRLNGQPLSPEEREDWEQWRARRVSARSAARNGDTPGAVQCARATPTLNGNGSRPQIDDIPDLTTRGGS